MKEFKMVKSATEDIEVFDEEQVIDAHEIERMMLGRTITIRADGEFMGKAMFLPLYYNWHLGKDNRGVTILVATKL